MGSYGTPLGETKSYRVYLNINTSDEYNKFRFVISRKKDNVDLGYYDDCSAEELKEVDKFKEELNKNYTLFWIADKGLRDKAEFEQRFQDIEKENGRLREQLESLRTKITIIKSML